MSVGPLVFIALQSSVWNWLHWLLYDELGIKRRGFAISIDRYHTNYYNFLIIFYCYTEPNVYPGIHVWLPRKYVIEILNNDIREQINLFHPTFWHLSLFFSLSEDHFQSSKKIDMNGKMPDMSSVGNDYHFNQTFFTRNKFLSVFY